MSDENIQPEATDEESVAPGEMNTPAEPEASEPVSPAADAGAETEQPKAARKPRAAKKDADVADAEAPAEEEAPKPARKPRAAKPKAEEAAAEAPKTEKPAPAAKPKRGAAKQPEQPVAAMVVRAQAKYVRSSARKARLVCDNIRGKSVTDARAILAHTPRAVARDWSKLLESAVANAENNHDLDGEDLVIKAVHADEGPTIKRFRPRAMGRAAKIRKRTAHLTILLTPKN